MTTGRMAQRATAEALGTALLLSAVVGSAVMAERLSGGNAALALLANAAATGAALLALLLALGPISGAHLNPAVTLALASQGRLPWREAPVYLLAQFTGGVAGVVLAHAMFGLPAFSISTQVRAGAPQLLGEAVATFGLLAVIFGCSRHPPGLVAFAVAAYITAAYWFTSSTSFANPAVTLARAFTNSWAGIRPVDVPGFVLAQAVGAATATALFRWLLPRGADEAAAQAPMPAAGKCSATSQGP